MKMFVFSALGVLVGVFLFIGLLTRIRYRIGSRHLKVFLFGIRIRRVALANIESVSKRPGGGWAEHWWSTTHPKHRMLVIRRRRGLFRNFVITPKNRYVFKTDLERALQRIENPRAHGGNEPEESEPRPPASSLETSAPPESSSDRPFNSLREQ